MSTAANFVTALASIQRVGLTGGSFTHAERLNLLACIRAQAAVGVANGLIATQCATLAGIGGASATCGTAIAAAMATLVAAQTGTLVVNAVTDGDP